MRTKISIILFLSIFSALSFAQGQSSPFAPDSSELSFWLSQQFPKKEKNSPFELTGTKRFLEEIFEQMNDLKDVSVLRFSWDQFVIKLPLHLAESLPRNFRDTFFGRKHLELQMDVVMQASGCQHLDGEIVLGSTPILFLLVGEISQEKIKSFLPARIEISLKKIRETKANLEQDCRGPIELQLLLLEVDPKVYGSVESLPTVLQYENQVVLRKKGPIFSDLGPLVMSEMQQRGLNVEFKSWPQRIRKTFKALRYYGNILSWPQYQVLDVLGKIEITDLNSSFKIENYYLEADFQASLNSD